MKKLMISLVMAWFIAAGSGLAFGAEATPVTTPAVKAMHHKKTGHKKTGHKKKKKSKTKKAAKPMATPTAN